MILASFEVRLPKIRCTFFVCVFFGIGGGGGVVTIIIFSWGVYVGVPLYRETTRYTQTFLD